jgi:hypothetical protein
LAFGIWHTSDASLKLGSSKLQSTGPDIIAALDEEAALTTGKIWAEDSEEQQ